MPSSKKGTVYTEKGHFAYKFVKKWGYWPHVPPVPTSMPIDKKLGFCHIFLHASSISKPVCFKVQDTSTAAMTFVRNRKTGENVLYTRGCLVHFQEVREFSSNEADSNNKGNTVYPQISTRKRICKK